MMKFLDFEPTKIAQWQTLVVEAANQAGYQFDDALESYLVFTLDQFTHDVQLASSVIAIDFLNSRHLLGNRRGRLLRSIGDQCLLLSGLFPEQASHKNISLNYFINVGQEAYYIIASSKNNLLYDKQLFYALSEHFVGLMDLLHTMRNISKSM